MSQIGPRGLDIGLEAEKQDKNKAALEVDKETAKEQQRNRREVKEGDGKIQQRQKTEKNIFIGQEMEGRITEKAR